MQEKRPNKHVALKKVKKILPEFKCEINEKFTASGIVYVVSAVVHGKSYTLEGVSRGNMLEGVANLVLEDLLDKQTDVTNAADFLGRKYPGIEYKMQIEGPDHATLFTAEGEYALCILIGIY